MKSFETLSEKQQLIITESVHTVLMAYIIGGAKKKSVDKKRHAALVIRAFNGLCKVQNVSVTERVEMLPIVTGIATDTIKF